MTGNLVLASYPKSGNTWLRAFLSNLRQDSTTPVDINKLDGIGAFSMALFEEAVGVEPSSLLEDEIERCRYFVFQYLASQSGEPLFLKTHDAYTLLPGGQPFVPAETVTAAVYILRNPLDVAVSFAHHLGRTIDHTIDKILSAPFVSRTSRGEGHVQQQFLSWSDHVLSWVDQKNIRLHVVRYEDMQERPVETFSAIARFCELPWEADRIQRAMQHSSFEQLQSQEREKGFKERSVRATAFFRSGKAGAWKDVLTEAQVDRIIQDHGPVMRRFGYL